MVDMVVFPSSYFSLTEVDEDLMPEFKAVQETGLFRTVLFGYEKWFSESRLVIRDTPEEEHLAIYRGWMMKPEQYERFYALLLKNRIRLITNPEQYAQMHLFPNVYKSIQEDTAKMEVYPLNEEINVQRLKKSFNRFMVKDFVKSVKGTEFPPFFDETVSQEDFNRWMEVFYKYRGELLTGGICIKEFFDLKTYSHHTNEYRVFYINHIAAVVWRNSGQVEETPEPPKSMIEKYKELPSPYFTIDYAELEDGSWRIVETGDGGVSGLPDYQDYAGYFRTLFECFRDCNDGC